MGQIGWDFSGKVALVTGGSGGIGKEIVTQLAHSGANVFFTYNCNEKAAEELSVALNTEQQCVQAIKCDLNSNADIERLVKAVAPSGRTPLDFLINNAGIMGVGPLYGQPDQQWLRTMQVNLNAAAFLSRAFIRQLTVSRGNIVNITSVAAEIGGIAQTGYTASKAGLIGLTKSLAKELGPSGIRVNCVAPGSIETRFLKITEERRKELKRFTPLARIGEPHEVSNAVMFLISDAASYITSTVLHVDGGIL